MDTTLNAARRNACSRLIAVGVGEAECGHRYSDHDHGHVKAEFRVLKNDFEIALDQLVMQGKVHPAQEHEQDNDRFKVKIVEMADTGLVR